MQSVNKRYLICQKPTQEDLCETLFAEHISLQRRNRGQRYNKICGYARKIAFWGDFSSVRCKSTPQSHKLCREPRLCKV